MQEVCVKFWSVYKLNDVLLQIDALMRICMAMRFITMPDFRLDFTL